MYSVDDIHVYAGRALCPYGVIALCGLCVRTCSRVKVNDLQAQIET